MEIMCRRAEERAVKSSKNIRKRVGGEEEPNKRNKKKMRKLKHAVANEDWGLESDELAELERREIGRSRFLHSDTSWATVGTNQTKIRIWSELELVARQLIITASREACDLVVSKLEEQSLKDHVRWLETAAAVEEFENVADCWKNVDMVPDGWKPQGQHSEEHENVPVGWKPRSLDSEEKESVPEGWRKSDMVPEEQKLKFRFKQDSIKKYFRSQKVIDFDEEMRQLEKERLVEKKRMKERKLDGALWSRLRPRRRNRDLEDLL